MAQFLIVDDASVVRKVARRIVEDFGFEPGEAGWLLDAGMIDS